MLHLITRIANTAFAPVRRWLRWKRSQERLGPEQRICISDDDIALVRIASGTDVWRTRWSDVKEIVAYKRDLYVVDLICLGLQCDDGLFFECCEENAGWDGLMAELDRRFRVDHGWWSNVAFPAFATNPTVVWRRDT